MKLTNALWASTLMVGAVSASAHHRRQHHHPLRRSLNDTQAETCLPQCTTYVTSYLVDVEHPTPAPVPSPTSVEVVTVSPLPEENPVVEVTVCPTPGTYTIPATTVIVTQTTAVCVGSTTDVPAGTHTVGGVTTVVETATTIVCPVATTKTVDNTVTSVIQQTTYVCPTPGTYTIGPVTTVVPTGGPIVVPSASVVAPGTYCHEEIVTVIDVTNYVVTCPLTTVEVTATVVPVAPTEAPAKPTESPTEETPKEEEEEEKEPVEEKPVEEKPSELKPITKPVGGKHYAITYSQYNDDRTCKGAADVERDIAQIAKKGFTAVRVYSPECQGLENVGSACAKYGLKIIIGVFIRAGGVSTGDKEVEAIKKWAKWGLVDLVVIGNEAVFNGFCTAHELAAYIKKVGAEFRGLGYKGKITTTEPVNILEANADALCPVIDIVGVNIHPFFDGKTKASEAGTFLKSQLGLVTKKCNKPTVVLEAGWPSGGVRNGNAIPSKEEQAAAIRSIRDAGDENIVYFTWTNDGWKDGGAFGVENNFGCGDLF